MQHSRTSGDLGADVGASGGLNAQMRCDIDRDGLLSVGIHTAATNYKDHSPTHYLGHPRFEDVYYESTMITAGTVSSLSIVGHVTQRVGAIRPHFDLGISRLRFSSSSYFSQETADAPIVHASRSDVSWAGLFGGGIEVPIGHNQMTVLDIGARYMFAAEARWMRQGDVEVREDRSVSMNPSRDRSDMLSFSLGIRFALRQFLNR